MNKVYLVGAGPGDPDLITVKGRRILKSAGAIFYDHLANPALLDLAPASARKVYVGKKRSAHSFQQEEISAMLVEAFHEGLNVVRLKGGDPYIFGRGGEEAEALAAAGIPFEVVPGVTAALGIAAYTGVPLTHRSHTSVVTFVTGHEVELIDWNKIGHAETLVIMMGLTTFPEIAQRMIAAGRSRHTPAMVVRWGTRPDQETLVGTLQTLPGIIADLHLKPPATLIIGEVVDLRGRLNWFEKLPLFGKTVVVTRPQDQSAALSAQLRGEGAAVVSLPTIEIAPPEDFAALDQAIARLAAYDWLIFTSANGVRAFLERLDRAPNDLRALRAKLAAIGPATRAALESLHLKVDVTGAEYVAEGLLAALPSDFAGQKILLARAAVARDVLPRELAARGATVDVVEAYRTIAPAGLPAAAQEILSASHKPDWITFTSSSTVENLMRVVRPEQLEGVRVASIGPVTSATIRHYGLTVDAEAAAYTADGLAAAIRELVIIET